MNHNKQGRDTMTNKQLTTISSGRSAERSTAYRRWRRGGRVVLLLSIFALSAAELMAQERHQSHQAREQALGCKRLTCCRALSPDPLREDSA